MSWLVQDSGMAHALRLGGGGIISADGLHPVGRKVLVLKLELVLVAGAGGCAAAIFIRIPRDPARGYSSPKLDSGSGYMCTCTMQCLMLIRLKQLSVLINLAKERKKKKRRETKGSVAQRGQCCAMWILSSLPKLATLYHSGMVDLALAHRHRRHGLYTLLGIL